MKKRYLPSTLLSFCENQGFALYHFFQILESVKNLEKAKKRKALTFFRKNFLKLL